MNEEIKPGDLVIIVKPSLCCGSKKSIGLISKIIPSLNMEPASRCKYCKAISFDRKDELKMETGAYVDKARLKKIPPLSELESTEDHVSINEPVNG